MGTNERRREEQSVPDGLADEQLSDVVKSSRSIRDDVQNLKFQISDLTDFNESGIPSHGTLEMKDSANPDSVLHVQFTLVCELSLSGGAAINREDIEDPGSRPAHDQL